MHLNCTRYCYLHSLSTIHKQTVVKWYHVVNASKLYMGTVIYTAYPPFINRQLSNGTMWWMHLNCTRYCYLHSLSTIHKQTVVKWYRVVNASKLYMGTVIYTAYPPFISRQLSNGTVWWMHLNCTWVLLSTQLIHHSWTDSCLVLNGQSTHWKIVPSILSSVNTEIWPSFITWTSKFRHKE